MQATCDTTFANMTASGIITRQPSFLCCVILTADESGDYIELYEGKDATSGRKILTLKALVNRSVAFNFTSPVLCQRGLYIHFEDDKCEATVIFTPVEYEDIRPKGD